MSLEGKTLGFAFGFGGQAPLAAGTFIVRTPNQPSGAEPLTSPLGGDAADFPRFNFDFGFETFGDEFEGYPGSTDWEINGRENNLPFNVDIDWIEEAGKEFGLVNIRWINNDNSVFTTDQLDIIYDSVDSNGDPAINFFGLAIYDIPNDASGLGPIESATWLTTFANPENSTLGPDVLPVIQNDAPFTSSLASGSNVVAINLIGRKGEVGNSGVGVTSFNTGSQIFKINLKPGGDLAIEDIPEPPLVPEGIGGVPGLTTESSIFEQETEVFAKPLRSRRFGRSSKSNSIQWKGKNEESSFVTYKHSGKAWQSRDVSLVAAVWEKNGRPDRQFGLPEDSNTRAIFSNVFNPKKGSKNFISFNNLSLNALTLGDSKGTQYVTGIIDVDTGKVITQSNVNFEKVLNRKTARKLEKFGYQPQETNNDLPGFLPFVLEETDSSASERPTTPAADVGLTSEESGDGPGSLDPIPEMPGTPDDGDSNPTDPGSSVPGGGGSNPTDPGSSVPGNSGTDPITGVSALVGGTAPDGSALVPAFFGPFQEALSNLRALKVKADLLQTDWEGLKPFEFSSDSLGGDLTNLSKGFDPQIGFEGNLFSGINQSNFWKNSSQNSTNNFMDL